MHKQLASPAGSTGLPAAAILPRQMPKQEVLHTGVSRSASRSSAIYAILDAIQQGLDFVCTCRSVEQRNGYLAAECAVRCG